MSGAYPAQSLVELIHHLATVDGNETVLHLRSGRDLRGSIVQIVRGRQEDTVIVAGRDGATYVPILAIEAITTSAVRPAQIAPPPTRLAARRILEEARRRIAAATGAEIALVAPIDATEDGEPLRALTEVATGSATAIEAAARDAMGKAALAARVRTVKLEPGAVPAVTLSGDVLTFVVTSADARLGPADLQSAVEALF